VSPEATFREETVAAQVITIITQLVSDVHSSFGTAPATTLQSSLDRDLALDSLARTELLLRLSRAFKVRLPDSLLAEANTPADLIAAILHAAPHPEQPLERMSTPAPSRSPMAEPIEAVTLIDVLAAHVRAHPDQVHLHHRQSDGTEEPLTYAQLERVARAVAAGLLDLGVSPGERVGIMLPTEQFFFTGFFGVLFAGGIPVPIYPPFRRALLEEHLRRQASILATPKLRFSSRTRRSRLLPGFSRDLFSVSITSPRSKSLQSLPRSQLRYRQGPTQPH
jgi:acyl carrier protein